MFIRCLLPLPSLFIILASFQFSMLSLSAATAPRIAVIPISDNAPPTLNAAKVTASQVETLLNQQGRLDVVDSVSVARVVRLVKEKNGAAEIDWHDIAENLGLDMVALVSVIDARVEYLGSQFDHLAVGELDSTPGQRHLYEGKATVRLTVVDVEQGTTLLDREEKGARTEGYRQSHDASKYAEIVTAVRDLVAIFDESVKTETGTTLTEGYSHLAMAAIEQATKKLDGPLQEAFPLRGTILLIEGGRLTVDLGSTSGIKKGMKFEVVRPGKVLVHPTTGEKLPTGEESIGTAKVRSVSSNTSILEIGRKAAASVEIGNSVVEDN
ncbi:MAG: FlgT C-terminal domain-containing protein [bacterium]